MAAIAAVGQLLGLHAALLGIWAACVKATATRHVHRRGDVAGYRRRAAPPLRVGLRMGVQQRTGIGMAWRAEDLRRRALLDDLAEVHDGHRVGYLSDHGELMGDEQRGQSELVGEFAQQSQDLGLDRDVQRGDGLVRDQHVGFERERPRDHGALALTPAERLWRTPIRGARQSDELEQLLDVSALAGGVDEPVHARRFPDRRADCHTRVEGGVGILEDHLHSLAHGAELGAAEREQVAVLEANAALVGLDQAQHAASEGGLAAARLTDHAEHFAADATPATLRPPRSAHARAGGAPTAAESVTRRSACTAPRPS